MLAFRENHWGEHSFSLISVVFLMTALGFLMVSEIPYPKISAIKFRAWRTLLIVQVAVFGVTFYILNLESAIATIFLTFLVLSPFYCISLNSNLPSSESEEGGA